MNINYFKAAEADVASLPKLKRALQLLTKKRIRIIEEGSPTDPSAIDYSKPYTDTHFVNDTLNDLLELAEMNRAIEKTERKIAEIEEILSELTKEQREVLTLFYIECFSADRIAEKIFVESEKTVYNIRNRAIAEYALLAYGVPADGNRTKM